MNLKIAYLYPDLLNNYGNDGNILTLKKRCEWRNIEVIIDEIKAGDTISEHDLYYIGDGEGIPQLRASEELLKNKDFFLKERERMSVFLGVCGGYTILGKNYQQKDNTIEGLELLNTYSKQAEKRHSGNVTVETEYVTPNTLVGFENNTNKTFLEEGTEPLGTTIVGYGNNGKDQTEGAKLKNVFGTNLSGPILPKNPHFADYLIELALGSKPETIDDNLEMATHNSLIHKTY